MLRLRTLKGALELIGVLIVIILLMAGGVYYMLGPEGFDPETYASLDPFGRVIAGLLVLLGFLGGIFLGLELLRGRSEYFTILHQDLIERPGKKRWQLGMFLLALLTAVLAVVKIAMGPGSG